MGSVMVGSKVKVVMALDRFAHQGISDGAHRSFTRLFLVLVVSYLCEKGQIFQEDKMSSWDSGLYIQVKYMRMIKVPSHFLG